MAYYVFEYRYADMEARARVRHLHLDYMRRLNVEGKVVLAGPIGDGSGAMVVYNTADEAEARSLIDADPYTIEGVSADSRLREWSVVIPDQS